MKIPNNRPFLTITFRSRPRPGQNTSVKNWGDKGEWDVNEQMLIVERITDKILAESHVILDILQNKTIKNRFELDNESIFASYTNRYIEDIKKAVEYWSKRDVKYMLYLATMKAEYLANNPEPVVDQVELPAIESKVEESVEPVETKPKRTRKKKIETTDV